MTLLQALEGWLILNELALLAMIKRPRRMMNEFRENQDGFSPRPVPDSARQFILPVGGRDNSTARASRATLERSGLAQAVLDIFLAFAASGLAVGVTVLFFLFVGF